jgi:hypothetical protein
MITWAPRVSIHRDGIYRLGNGKTSFEFLILTRTIKISVRRLADVIGPDDIARPALLKLDVQGYELLALHGCLKLLPEFDYVYVECSYLELYEGQALADEVIELLQQQGFSVSGKFNLVSREDPTPVQSDS